MKMKWRHGKTPEGKQDAYYVESDAHYTIAKVTVQGILIYESWTPQKMFLGPSESYEHARQLCQTDYDLKHPEKAKGQQWINQIKQEIN